MKEYLYFKTNFSQMICDVTYDQYVSITNSNIFKEVKDSLDDINTHIFMIYKSVKHLNSIYCRALFFK